MAKQISTLFITPEVYPFTKETCIADVSYSLSLALRDCGHDTRVMLPKYGTISERKNRIHDINRLKDLKVEVGDLEVETSIKSSSINNPRTKVQAYITTNYEYFDSKKGIYLDPKTNQEFENQVERFIFFSKTVVETCVMLNWFPNIIHMNDWYSGIVAAYAKTYYPKEFKKTKFLLNIHNVHNQGIEDISVFEKTGLGKEYKSIFTHDKKFNMLKGSILSADYVVIVGKTYAEDILKDKKLAGDMYPFLKDKKKNYSGISNRIDKWIWNPSNGGTIEFPYEDDFEEYKYHNKVALINKFGFEFAPKIPLIAMVGRYGLETNIKLLKDAATKLFKENIQMLYYGPYNKELEKELSKISSKYPEKFKYMFSENEDMGHLIEAGSDIYLIIPEYETCGLNFMYSCTYGSVPVVLETGILPELTEEWDDEEEEGYSISIKENTGDELVKALKKAINLYEDQERWILLARNGMLEEFDWSEEIVHYDDIYKKLAR